jgi:hypothetical protein
MDPQLLLPPGAGLVVEQVQLCDEVVHLTVRCEASGAHCPDCGIWSKAFHSDYERNLADPPIAGRQAVIDLRVRRFRCYEPKCLRKTFVEQAPIVSERYAHRTLRLRSALEGIGIALGGRPGSRQCKRLAMPTSRTTLLRVVRALHEPPVETTRVLGMDEFALRRGRRYGTILVDADSHHIVDLQEDPSADAVVDWPGNHPGTEIICRDRDGIFARSSRCRPLGGLRPGVLHRCGHPADPPQRVARVQRCPTPSRVNRGRFISTICGTPTRRICFGRASESRQLARVWAIRALQSRAICISMSPQKSTRKLQSVLPRYCGSQSSVHCRPVSIVYRIVYDRSEIERWVARTFGI